MREEFLKFEYLEDALAIIFDESPGLKSSSVAHKLGVGSGIQIGSRDQRFVLFDDFIEKVTRATISLDKKHYKVIYEWYRANDHQNEGDFGTGLGFIKFHEIRKEALELLSLELSEKNKTRQSQTIEEEPHFVLVVGSPIQITGGPPELIGQVAYFDKFIDDFKDRLICNYFKSGVRQMYITNLSEIRSVN